MKKPKVLIIVLFQNLRDEEPYYARNPAPPLPGILLAGMTPSTVDVEVLHEMVRPIDYNSDADLIALSFLDYLAPHAFDVAQTFRELGKMVVAGGKFASTFPEEVQPHFDSILVGEAQGVWPRMVNDWLSGQLRSRYDAAAVPCLENIPPPRFDLVEKKFSVPVVIEASRGCPHPCTYCALNINRIVYRTRPVADVINDLKAASTLPWHRRKLAMILDNNLGGDLAFAKELLRELAKLPFWGYGTQFSIECLRDPEFVDLLAKARVRMAFIGMESLNETSLESVKKRQNKVKEYHDAFEGLHRRGILTFTGLMIGLDEDTQEYYDTLPERLEEAGCSVILPSITIPIYGTPLHTEMVNEGRLIDTDLSHYEGDHLVFHHRHMTPQQIFTAYRRINKIFYSWKNIVRRWLKIMRLQTKEESLFQFILKLGIVSFAYFQLSVFQRHHAQERVFSKAANYAYNTGKRKRHARVRPASPEPAVIKGSVMGVQFQFAAKPR